MRKNSLALASTLALLVNTIGLGVGPLPATAAPVSASLDPLPAWFTSVDDEHFPAGDPETYTDGVGRYRFQGLPHGTHKVTLDPTTLPPSLRPAEGEAIPTLWITPGQEQTSGPLSTGVRFTVAYDRASGEISGLVFADQDGDGRPDPDEPGLAGVRVVDPTLHQYFVPFDDRNLWILFQDKASCHNPTHLACGPLMSFIHLTASSDGTTYYYDHWEDGYDADPLVPGATTEVGMLDAGAHQTFESSIDPTALPWPPLAPPYYYDGRDRITIVGEPATVVRLAHPSSYSTNGRCPGRANTSGWLASAWEVPEVADWGTEYVATVGEDMNYSGGTPDDHDYTGLEVMAWQDNTDVYYDGVFVANLPAGQIRTYFVQGANDGPGLGGVDSDDTITATKPIQVQMVTGACSTAPSAYVSAHGYTLQPVEGWGNVYWAPVPGFTQACNPDNRNVDTDIYLHNPHSGPITVTVISNSGVADVSIAPNTSASVLDATGWADLASGDQGARLSSSDTFWGMAVIDSATNGATAADDWDWGYSLIPESRLSSQAIVCFGPGNGDAPPSDNGNLAFVTAVTDTVIYVDTNQDGLPDPIDMNGDGDHDDYNVLGVTTWDEPTSALGIPLAARQVLRVGDPFDRDMTGALIYTQGLDQKIAVAWGQDPCAATFSAPYLDLGYTVLPPPIPSLSKVDKLAVDADLSGGVSPGDTITYTLVLYNNGKGAMSDVVLTDPLPYTYTNFVTGSVQVTTPGATEYSNDGINFGVSENPDIRAFRITWPSIGSGQTVTTTFRVQLRADIPVTIDEISNQAVVDSTETDPRRSEDPDDPPDPDTDTPVGRPLLSIDKRAFPPVIQPGGRISYTLVISNYGNGVALLTSITDILPAWVDYVSDTLDITWPVAQVQVTTRDITETASFHGYYADDFDLNPTESTGYTGDDGSLAWSTNWTEINDDGNPASGEIQVPTPPDLNALSLPGYLRVEDTDDGDDASVQRTFDLSQFQAPWLRYHVQGTTNSADDLYRVTVTGVVPDFEDQYSGEYTVQELDISDAAGTSPVTLSFEGTDGMEPGEYYRFDHISVFETAPVREVTRTLTSESTTLIYNTSTDGNPDSYDQPTGLMVITDGLRLPAGGYITVTFQAQAQSPLTDDLTLANTACVTAPNWLNVLSPPCDDAGVLVQASHALTLTKTAAPSPAGIGSPLTYTLHYTITGNEAVESMVISDTTPPNTTFFTATATPASALISVPPGPVTWQVSGLWPPGSGTAQASGTLQMVVLVNSGLISGTLIRNAAVITDTTGLTDTDETTTTVVLATDLAIIKTDEPDPVIPGETLTYTLRVINYGPAEAVNVVVTDTLPPEVTFVSADPLPRPTAPPLVWDLVEPLAPGATRLITVVVTVLQDVDQTFTNTAWVSSDTSDLNPDNNRDDEPTSPPMPGLELVKTVDPYHAARDMPFTYRLRVTNTGDFPFNSLQLTDNLPSANFYFIPGSGDPVDPDIIAGPLLVWSDLLPAPLDELPPGESLTVSYQVTTTEPNGVYTNTAEVEGKYVGGTLTATDDAIVSVADPAVAIEKRLVDLDRDPVAPNYVTFTIVITNVGPSTIDVLPLADEYDTTFLEFVDATPYPQADADDGLVTWNDLTGPVPYGFNRNLPPGDAFSITTVFRIVRDLFATTNVATVSGATDIYGNPADEVQDDEIIRNAPTPIELLYFRAVAEKEAVRLEWATLVELDRVGFYVYRAPDASFGNARPIAYYDAIGGGSYTHPDYDVTSGQVYWYWLVKVGIDGPEQPHGPVWSGIDIDQSQTRLYLPLVQKGFVQDKVHAR